MSLAVHKRRFASIRSIIALILREMTTTYGRSPGGYAWAILEPAAAIALFVLVLGYVTQVPPLGSSFPLFFATGFMPYMTYHGLTANVGMAVRYSAPLLAYPAVTYVDAVLARAILHVMTQIIVGLIIFVGIVQFEGLTLTIDPGALVNAILMVAVLGFGVGMLNSFLMSMFPIWVSIWAIINRPMVILSGVLFNIDGLPAAYRELLYYNPVVHLISAFRGAIYATYDAAMVSPLYVYAWGGGLTFIGFVLMYRYHNDILEL